MTLLNPFKKVGKTIILVSHALETVRTWCDETLWLDGGLVKTHGKPAEVVEAYAKAIL